MTQGLNVQNLILTTRDSDPTGGRRDLKTQVPREVVSWALKDSNSVRLHKLGVGVHDKRRPSTASIGHAQFHCKGRGKSAVIAFVRPHWSTTKWACKTPKKLTTKETAPAQTVVATQPEAPRVSHGGILRGMRKSLVWIRTVCIEYDTVWPLIIPGKDWLSSLWSWYFTTRAVRNMVEHTKYGLWINLVPFNTYFRMKYYIIRFKSSYDARRCPISSSKLSNVRSCGHLDEEYSKTCFQSCLVKLCPPKDGICDWIVETKTTWNSICTHPISHLQVYTNSQHSVLPKEAPNFFHTIIHTVVRYATLTCDLKFTWSHTIPGGREGTLIIP